MAPKQTPPFRAEHIGSLLRPDDLLEARRKFDKKEVTQEQLKEIEDRAIMGAIDMQREVGIKSFTDGEYRSVSKLHSRTLILTSHLGDTCMYRCDEHNQQLIV